MRHRVHFLYLHADHPRALVERFEVYFTPESVRWLRMIEIKLSVFRQCLDRRIPTMEQLGREVCAKVHPCIFPGNHDRLTIKHE